MNLICLFVKSALPINLKTTKVKVFSQFTAKEEFLTRKGAIFCEIFIDPIGTVNCINTHLGSVDYSMKRLEFKKNLQTDQERDDLLLGHPADLLEIRSDQAAHSSYRRDEDEEKG